MISRWRHLGFEEAVCLSLKIADARALGALVHAQIDTGSEVCGGDGIDTDNIVVRVVLAADDHVLRTIVVCVSLCIVRRT